MVLHAARGGGGGPAGPATQRACEGMEAPLSVSHDDSSRDALSPVRLDIRCRPTLVFSAVGGPSGEGVERTRGAAVEATEEVVDAQVNCVAFDVDGVVVVAFACKIYLPTGHGMFCGGMARHGARSHHTT